MSKQRLINFSAGPAMLAAPVLQEIQNSLMNWHSQGVSMLELGHRTDAFYQMTQTCKQDLKILLAVPDTHDILVTPCGASLHFSYLPLNLLGKHQVLDYADTGYWSKKAMSQAQKFATVKLATQVQETNNIRIAPSTTWALNKDAAFLHYTDNETIDGIEFNEVPVSPYAPLVTDMTSSILTKALPVEKFGVIYAGAQKNLGIAGISMLIIDKELLARCPNTLPDMFNYQVIAQNDSIVTTPPTFAWYVMGLVVAWVKAQGGVTFFQELSAQKSQHIYQIIDEDDFYINDIHPDYRSRLNIVFRLHDAELEEKFLAEAAEQGMIGLKGHKAKGGLRASLYNAIDLTATQQLGQFMCEFRQRYG